MIIIYLIILKNCLYDFKQFKYNYKMRILYFICLKDFFINIHNIEQGLHEQFLFSQKQKKY